MTKKEFMKKYGLNKIDYNRLLRYEEVRKEGKMNMWEYLGYMQHHEEISCEKNLSSLIPNNNFYGEFLETLKEKEK